MIPLRTALVALLAIIAVGCCVPVKPPAFGVLAVIGDVSHDSARILLELLVEPPDNPADSFASRRPMPVHHVCACSVLKIQNLEDMSSIVEVALPITNRPRVFELRGLHPGVHYDIIVENSEDTANSCEECAYSVPADALPLRFRTFSPPSAVSMQDTTLVVLSCDRYLDDQDDAFWAVLRPDVLPVKPHDAMFHIGDQVYTDTLASLVMNASIAIEFEELVERFRDLYRYSWSRDAMKTILRHGAHWMLPDDHDIINNADEHMLKHMVEARSGRGPGLNISPTSSREDKLAAVVMATGIATLEYQLALNAAFGLQTESRKFCPVSDGGSCLEVTAQQESWLELTHRLSSRDAEALPPAWTFRKVNHVGVAMVDTRMDRVFSMASSQWISPRQLQALEMQLDTWSKDVTVSDVVVMFGSPLLYLDGSLAELAVWWENERYSTLPSEVNTTVSVLDTLWKYRSKVSMVIGGDHHLHSHSLICKGSDCIPQVISSGMTRLSQTIDSWHLFLFQFVNQHFTTPSAGEYRTLISGKPDDSTLGNNFLLIQSGDTESLSACKGAFDDGKCWWRLDLDGSETLHSRLFTAGTPDNVATIQPWKYTPAGSLRYRSVFRVHQAARLVVLQAIFQHPVVAAGLLTLGVVVVFYCVSGVIGALFLASPRKPKSE